MVGSISFQVTAAVGLTLSVIGISISLWLHHHVAWEVLSATALIQAVVIPLSFLLAWVILKKNTKAAKAISFETSFQNVPTAFAFLMISYRGPMVAEMLPPLIFAGFSGLMEEVIVVIVYRLARLGTSRKVVVPENAEQVEKVDMEAEAAEKLDHLAPEIAEQMENVDMVVGKMEKMKETLHGNADQVVNVSAEAGEVEKVKEMVPENAGQVEK